MKLTREKVAAELKKARVAHSKLACKIYKLENRQRFLEVETTKKQIGQCFMSDESHGIVSYFKATGVRPDDASLTGIKIQIIDGTPYSIDVSSYMYQSLEWKSISEKEFNAAFKTALEACGPLP